METHTKQFDAIGTSWQITVTCCGGGEALWSEIKTRIAEFDGVYSRFRPDSLVSQMARRAGNYVLPDDAHPMLELYLDLAARTAGAFTPLIGRTLEDAGYDAGYSLQVKPLRAPQQVAEVLRYERPTLTLSEPALLDFGAAGKGYLVDILAAIIRRHGARAYTIDAGGDIAVYDEAGTAASIGLEDPRDPTRVIGAAQIQNQSICGSAGTRRSWGAYHHIIDPRTLRSPQHIVAVWVVAETTMLADALATALFLVDAEQLKRAYTFEYVIVSSNYSVNISSGFPGELFS